MFLKSIYEKLSAKQAAFISVFFWASAFVVTKSALKYTDTNTLGVGRYFVAGIILVGIIIKNKMKFPNIKDIPVFLLAGLCGYSGYVITFNIAMLKINPSTASVINALAPAITAIIAYFLFKEKIKIIGWVSLFISFIGILILSLWEGSLSLNSGLIYMFSACFFLSFYNISQRFLNKKYSSVEVSIYSMLFGSLELLFYSPTALLNIHKLSITVILMIFYLAIFSGIIAYMFWTRAFEVAKSTTEVTSFMFITPILSTIMEIIILGSTPKLSTLVGGGIIIIGMFIFNKTK